MSLKQVVWRVLNKAGTSFIEPATEDKQEEIKQEIVSLSQKTLTDVQLRSSPLNVDTGLVQPTTPSDTQPVSGSVSVANQPTEYPIPAAQLAELSPQKDGLTDAELRASAVIVDTGLTQPTTPQDVQPVSGTVDVGNFPADYALPTTQLNTLTPQKDSLTDVELRATPVNVDTGLVQPTTPSDTQPVSGSVSVANQPTEYPLPANQVQTDAITDQQLRAAPVSVTSKEAGDWDYYSGVSGTVSVTGRVLMISATGSSSGGSISINGGDLIPVAEFTSATLEPKANLTNPSVTFSGTGAYIIEVVR